MRYPSTKFEFLHGHYNVTCHTLKTGKVITKRTQLWSSTFALGNFPLLYIAVFPSLFSLHQFSSLSHFNLPPSVQCLASSIIHSSLNLLSFHLYMRAPYITNTVRLITYIGSEMNMSKECELQVLIICTVFCCLAIQCRP